MDRTRLPSFGGGNADHPQACMDCCDFFKNWAEKGEHFYSGHFLDLRTMGFGLSSYDP
jgi:hypothetical protein